ncbi:Adipocyte plasma membrane-associated protein [Sarcoptes scabiei]|nr:Adipocyte plasma membrane-associated protein [Sarcoptes scabiei]
MKSIQILIAIFTLLISIGLIRTNPVVTGGKIGPHGGGFGGGFAVGRSIMIGPGGKVKTGGFGPFFGGIPFLFRRK